MFKSLIDPTLSGSIESYLDGHDLKDPISKEAYFLAAIQTDALFKREWAISVFGILMQSPPSGDFPGQLTRDDIGCSFYDDQGERVYIKDSTNADAPLFKFSDELLLPGGILPNVPKDIRTTYGNLYFNALCLVYPFKGAIPYQNEMVDIGKLERKYIEPMLIDDPVPDNHS